MGVIVLFINIYISLKKIHTNTTGSHCGEWTLSEMFTASCNVTMYALPSAVGV